jgi:hypothetical protein
MYCENLYYHSCQVTGQWPCGVVEEVLGCFFTDHTKIIHKKFLLR